ncbi:HD family phosphohydrolase [Carboxydocella sp. ULO1]|uniref:HD family phosphohydrolase n=1 Tax=Carboxydocella sp. ULO1 TaxID=1926599 RepID=UPI0009AE43E0|nr:HDIG domain-containing metalloprotein [Carboxydocella sp. ULO1]GAW30188.1 phosphohydrolase [Carboxydocella sp. ULO1]
MNWQEQLRNLLLRGYVRKLWEQKEVRRALLAGFFFLAYFVVLSVNFLPDNINLKVGQVAPKNIFSPSSVVYVDEKATEARRQAAAATIVPVYDQNVTVASKLEEEVTGFFDQIRQARQQTQLNLTDKRLLVEKTLTIQVQDQEIEMLLTADDRTIDSLEQQALQLLRQAMTQGVPEDKLETEKERLRRQIGDLGLKKPYRDLLVRLTANILRPNLIINQEETKRRINEARQAVPPVTKSVLQNELIISKGERVTQETLEKLQAVGLMRPKSTWPVLLGIALMLALNFALTLAYLIYFRPDLYHNEKQLSLLALIGLISLLIIRGFLALNFSDRPEINVLSAYMVPVAAASMLITVLLDSQLALLITLLLNWWLGVLSGFQLRFALVGLVSGIFAIYGLRRVTQRSDLVKTGLMHVALSAVAMIISVCLVTDVSPSLTGVAIAYGVVNGVLSAVLAGGFLPLLESAFDLTSPMRLLEITNPNAPLLKELLMEAPGTYHHAIIVGNLAEAAADAIGADSLVCRAGAYYHDVGKIQRPGFFIENQMSGTNPHERIAPSLSTLIITSHVKDGVELGRKYRLPQAVLDIIAQHHGTCLVSYFYHRAKEADRLETVQEEDYRYPGPKPQTREAAIVMLADSVEAAVRAKMQAGQLAGLGPLEGFVRKIIKEKLTDGQLDESDLTLRDLEKIAQAFMKVLKGIVHARIEYPEELKGLERGSANADSDRESPEPAGNNSGNA